MMRWVVPVVAVALLATGYAVGTAGADSRRQPGTYVLRDSAEIYIPALDLRRWYGRIAGPWRPDLQRRLRWPGLWLDCGNRSTEMEGVRIMISPKVAELWHFAEGFDPAWKLLARARRP
jgi:hypothetical protein